MAKTKTEQLALLWESQDHPIHWFDPSDIEPWPGLNPRRHFDEKKIDELADSIKKNGVLQNIVVQNGTDHIIAGESRWRACKKAGVKIPARVVDVSESEALKIAMLENLHRNSLTPMEEARGFERMLKLDKTLTQQKVAKELGLSQSVIAARLALLDLPEQIQTLIELGTLPASLARDYLYAWTKETPAKRTRFFSTLVQLINTRPDVTDPVTVIWLKPVVQKLKDTIGMTAKAKTPAKPAKKGKKKPARENLRKDASAGTKKALNALTPDDHEEEPPAADSVLSASEDDSKERDDDADDGASSIVADRLEPEPEPVIYRAVGGLIGALLPLLAEHSLSLTFAKVSAEGDELPVGQEPDVYVVVAPKSTVSRKEISPLAFTAVPSHIEQRLIEDLPAYIEQLTPKAEAA